MSGRGAVARATYARRSNDGGPELTGVDPGGIRKKATRPTRPWLLVAALAVISLGISFVPPSAASPRLGGDASPAAGPEDSAAVPWCENFGSRVRGICELWVARYDAPGFSWDFGADVAVAPNGGRVFVTGQSGGGPYSQDGDYATAAYDAATGERLWVARYDGPGGAGPFFGSGDGMDDALAIAADPDGNRVYVTGSSWGGEESNMDMATVAYDGATGEELWVGRHGAGGDDVAVSPDGARVYATGDIFRGPGEKVNYDTVAYDAVTGEELWVAAYNNPDGNREDVTSALDVSGDGARVFITGWSLPAEGFSRDYTTVAYDAVTGEELWVSRYGRGNSQPWAIGSSPDGSRVFVTGQTGPSATTVAYDGATGEQQWVADYRVPDSFQDSLAESLAVSPDGTRVYITGPSDHPDSGYDYATIAYDAATGDEVWVERYNGLCGRVQSGSGGRTDDLAQSVVAAPDGERVYVTGTSVSHGDCSFQDLEQTVNGRDYTTIAYGASDGERLWVSRYDGSGGTDVSVAAAVAPNGDRLFVTGWSPGGRGPNDYATVAYEIGDPEPAPSPSPTETAAPPPSPPPPSSSRGTYPEVPDDEYFADQWGLQTIGAPEAWQLSRATGSGIRVAVVDTGVDLDHEDLQCPGKLEVFRGADIVKDGNGPDDFNGHGTHVSGVIAACTDNATGIGGVAPDAVVMPVQVFDPDGSTFAEVAVGIRRATDAGAHVINLSLGPEIGPVSYVPGLFDDVEEAIEHARDNGVVLVAAAGNDSTPLCEYPALSEHVICVGATDSRDLKAWYSTFPVKPDPDRFAVVAPGGTETVAFCNIPEETILSLWPRVLDRCNEGRPGYQDMAGTSMATPHVAGTAALVYDRLGGDRSADNGEQVRQAIISSAHDLGAPGYDPVFGFGRVDALAAVQEIEVEPEPTPTPSPSPDPESTETSFTENSANSGQYSDETLFEASLVDSDDDPIADAEVTFELAGTEPPRTFTATTDQDGVAAVTPMLEEIPGAYQLTVRFDGDDDHEGSADTTSFVVEKEDTDLELEVEGRGKNRTLTARLSDLDTSSDGIEGRAVDFYADGEFIGSETTDADGVATLEPPPRYRGGPHEFEARFDGDEYYLTSADRRQS